MKREPGELSSDSELHSTRSYSPSVTCDGDEQAAAAFDKGLSDFLKKSRAEEEHRRHQLAEFERKVEERIAKIKKQKDVVTESASMSFDQRFKRLRAVFNVGDKFEDYRQESRRQRKTAMVVKLMASEKYKQAFGKVLDTKIVSYQNRIMDRKKDYIDYLGEEVTKRERMWQQTRAKDKSWREDLAALQKSANPDAYKLRLLREIKDAHAKLDKYMDTEGVAVEKNIRNRQRKRILAPSKADGPSRNKIRVIDGKKMQCEDDIIDNGAQRIARYTLGWQETMVGGETVMKGDTDFEEDIATQPEYVHECQLLGAIWPNAYKGKPWTIRHTDADNEFEAENAECEDVASLANLFKRQDAILHAVRNIQHVQHVHSLAFTTLLENVSNVRVAVAKDGAVQMRLAKEMEAANRSRLLASDPDLKQLPFTTIAAIARFFLDESRVCKLAKYIMKYVKYQKINYATNITSALLHPQLVGVALWAGPEERG